MTHLGGVALYGSNDPLFPATAIVPRANVGFEASGFDCRPWNST